MYARQRCIFYTVKNTANNVQHGPEGHYDHHKCQETSDIWAGGGVCRVKCSQNGGILTFDEDVKGSKKSLQRLPMQIIISSPSEYNQEACCWINILSSHSKAKAGLGFGRNEKR